MKRVVIVLLVLFIVLNFLIMMLPYISLKKLDIQNLEITGRGTSGTVGLVILSPTLNIFIDSPQNITYNFSIGDNYTIGLNVSADSTVDTWWYTLEDLTHGEIVNQSVIFTPNTTINAVRWSNKLTVFANDSSGNEVNSSVTFYVSVPNSSPILGNISTNILVCEAKSLSYNFNATDADEDVLEFSLSVLNPFFITPSFSSGGETTVQAQLFSGTLTKSHIGLHPETISASDSVYIDTKKTNITVIEINNKPTVQNIGVQTLWTQGDNSTLYKEVQVSDVENGNQTSGNFTFNLTFLTGSKFFDTSQLGIMNLTANSSIVGVYNISFCVTDLAIESISPNISFCGQSGLNQTACQNFSLTITDENRVPTIKSNYPSNLTINSIGTGNLYFNISKYDPDGTVPDAYWYVDDSLREYDSGNSYDEFNYNFGCGVGGSHTVKAEITDGLLNDSVEWDVSLTSVECPPETVGGGGGTGGGAIFGCVPQWVCDNWRVCQNSQRSLEIGLLSGEDYREIQNSCFNEKFDGNTCGVQIRDCLDLKSCNKTINKPSEFQSCHYVENPGCSDGIKNCHDGNCELLIDCGGPCKACPTCSDGIENQKEEGVDCGGPCPWKCVPEKPLPSKFYLIYWIFLGIIILFITIKIIRILKLKTKLNQMDKRLWK